MTQSLDPFSILLLHSISLEPVLQYDCITQTLHNFLPPDCTPQSLQLNTSFHSKVSAQPMSIILLQSGVSSTVCHLSGISVFYILLLELFDMLGISRRLQY